MQMTTRRGFLAMGAGASLALALPGLQAFAAQPAVKFKIGVTDWNLKQEGKLEAVALAKNLGFDGIQRGVLHHQGHNRSGQHLRQD